MYNDLAPNVHVLSWNALPLLKAHPSCTCAHDCVVILLWLGALLLTCVSHNYPQDRAGPRPRWDG